jgi:hypothetical protein
VESPTLPVSERETVRLDLREARSVEVRTVSVGRTIAAIILYPVLAYGILVLIVLLTKSSCPFVYVEEEGGALGLVGEAYPGATSRSTQRDDLLPLPPLGPKPRLVLANGADETQYTDVLEALVVDVPAGRRVLATHDARLLTVRDGIAPIRAADLDGRDVLPTVRDADAAVWQTDLDEATRREPSPAREGLVVEFPPQPAGTQLALELDAGNTPWLDLVFGRFFALMGEDLDRRLDRGDRPEKREPILAWRAREGVDLGVEIEREGSWSRVATVPTVGPAALRRFAVPLPPADGGPLRVRMTGGVGFWRFDHVALAPVDGPPPSAVAVAPRRAMAWDGADVRAALAASDGVYQVLAEKGQEVELRFELPEAAPGTARTAFLHTSGYYRVHPPPQPHRSNGTLLVLAREPGALSRFSLDLYRAYSRELAQADARP